MERELISGKQARLKSYNVRLTLFESSSILSDSLPMDMRISPCCCLVSAISTGTMASLAVGCGGGAGVGGGGAGYGAVIICGWGAIIG